MNIAVYCGSSFGVNPQFEETARELGKWIGTNGHTLIYGGSKVGLMGVVANEVLACGGQVIGVMPGFLGSRERLHEALTRLEMVETMSERKNRMMALSDAFVALPGGPGTIEEISEIISLARVKQLAKPCALYNIDGYYDKLREFYESMVPNGFIVEEELQVMRFVENLDEFVSYITMNELHEAK